MSIPARNNTETIILDWDYWVRQGHAYTAPVICITGFLCNILGSIVLIDMEMRAPITILLEGLAISNALTLVVYIPFAMLLLNISSKNVTYSAYSHAMMSIIAHIIINTSAISNWLTVTVALYMMAVLQRICDPFKRITSSRARHINYFVYMSVTAMCTPNYHDVFHSKTVVPSNITVWNLGTGFWMQEGTLLADFNIVVNSVLMRLIPCFILSVAVSSVVRNMQRAAKVSSKLPTVDLTEVTKWRSNRIHTMNITRTLMAVLIIFSATEFSNGMFMLLAYGSRYYYSFYTSLGHILATLALINYGVSFLLYCFMSQQFREACRQTSCYQI